MAACTVDTCPCWSKGIPTDRCLFTRDSRTKFPVEGCGCNHCFFERRDREEKARANATALADVLAEFLRDAAPDLDALEEIAADFQRDTGLLAPGKDEATAFNSGVTPEHWRQMWDQWSRRRMDARNQRARVALRAAGRLP